MTPQERADRIRHEQGLTSEGESAPQPCHWYDDGRGGRFLIPGCMTRAMNPDADSCGCKTIQEQLDDARDEIAQLVRFGKNSQHWRDCIVRAVHDHPDGAKIMKRAADLAELPDLFLKP